MGKMTTLVVRHVEPAVVERRRGVCRQSVGGEKLEGKTDWPKTPSRRLTSPAASRGGELNRGNCTRAVPGAFTLLFDANSACISHMLGFFSAACLSCLERCGGGEDGGAGVCALCIS